MSINVEHIWEETVAGFIVAATVGAISYLTRLGPKIWMYLSTRQMSTLNTIFAVALSIVVLVIWQLFFGLQPEGGN